MHLTRIHGADQGHQPGMRQGDMCTSIGCTRYHTHACSLTGEAARACALDAAALAAAVHDGCVAGCSARALRVPAGGPPPAGARSSA